ncbi:DUF4440 domain-containing protein [Burkholderiaceae bacterium UC74_6]
MIRALLLSIACMALPAHAQTSADGRGQGAPVMTLYMKTIGALEQELAAAQAAGNAAALDRLLGPFFELRRPRQEALTRESLLGAGRPRGGSAASLSELSVYEVGAEAVAYFLLREANGNTSSVVDVWTRGPDGRWQLRLRFEQAL